MLIRIGVGHWLSMSYATMSTTKIKAVIFDIDGTLVDDACNIILGVPAILQALKDRNIVTAVASHNSGPHRILRRHSFHYLHRDTDTFEI